MGCRYYETTGVVGCWTKCEDTWSGKCLGRMCLLFVFLGPEECFSGECWDRSLNSSVHTWSHGLLLEWINKTGPVTVL